MIWDLDETLVRGVFVEDDRDVDPKAQSLMERLRERGVLQALATQNEPEVMNEVVSHYGWEGVFQMMKGDFAPKRNKVVAILEDLEVSSDHTAFVDNDPFERDLMRAQIPGMAAWSVAQLETHVESLQGPVTEEARRRPQMYRAMLAHKTDEEKAGDVEAFLAGCDMTVTIRPYEKSDKPRAVELLARTNRMNLGTAVPPEEIVGVAGEAGGPRLLLAELRDRYGDSGRCGLIRLTPGVDGEATIDSIAISCRARVRGLSLALLLGMLQHPDGRFDRYRCLFHATGRNRPLRMLLWAAGFSSVPESKELRADRRALDAVALPAWVRIEHASKASHASGPPSPNERES